MIGIWILSKIESYKVIKLVIVLFIVPVIINSICFIFFDHFIKIDSNEPYFSKDMEKLIYDLDLDRSLSVVNENEE